MSKTFKRQIYESQSKYKAKIEQKNVNQQGSYNLNIDMENFLISNNMIELETPDAQRTNANYRLKEGVTVKLGENILAIIGEEYRNINNNVVFTHTEGDNGRTKKFQLKKTEFNNKNHDEFNWFVDLYEKNLENMNFVSKIDTENKVIKFDLELTPAFFSSSDESAQSDPLIHGYNKIYYGAPGCGKSHLVQQQLDDMGVPKENRIRVTFHPEYTNFDFVGQILPTIDEKTDETTGEIKRDVKYIFNKGPFTLALERAHQTHSMVYLIIEELNRGNAAAIFGDLFQLLDRNEDGNSEYPVNNVNIAKAIFDDEKHDIIIPNNLTIIATMNTSDQNVFTLDTAFKRRWEFEQVSNEFAATDANYGLYVPGTNLEWREFVKKINDKITDPTRTGLSGEDKRIGKYFVKNELLEASPTRLYEQVYDDGRQLISSTPNQDVIDKAKKFGYKILEYIWNDVAKFDEKTKWFDTTTYKTLEELLNGFIGENINNPLKVFKAIWGKD